MATTTLVRTKAVFTFTTAKHRKRFSQVDKGDEVEYNGFNLNAREKCYVSNLAQGKGVFW
jgi:hypothetical protein